MGLSVHPQTALAGTHATSQQQQQRLEPARHPSPLEARVGRLGAGVRTVVLMAGRMMIPVGKWMMVGGGVVPSRLELELLSW